MISKWNGGSWRRRSGHPGPADAARDQAIGYDVLRQLAPVRAHRGKSRSKNRSCSFDGLHHFRKRELGVLDVLAEHSLGDNWQGDALTTRHSAKTALCCIVFRSSTGGCRCNLRECVKTSRCSTSVWATRRAAATSRRSVITPGAILNITHAMAHRAGISLQRRTNWKKTTRVPIRQTRPPRERWLLTAANDKIQVATIWQGRGGLTGADCKKRRIWDEAGPHERVL